MTLPDHADDERLEWYCLGALPEPESAELEEHLLICETCRQRLSETSDYLQAMRAAAKRIRDVSGQP